MKKSLIVAAVIVVLLYFFGEKKWLGGGTTHLKWVEDVALASGDTVQIERDVKFRWAFIFLGGREGDDTLRSVVRPAGPSKTFPEWSAPMLPLLLEKDPTTGVWWLVATTTECDFWNRNQEPQPPYWAFVTDGGKWRRARVPDAYWGRLANLFVRYDFDDTDRVLRGTLVVRKAAQRPARIDDFYVLISKTIRCKCMRSNLPGLSKTELDLNEFWRP